MIPLCLVTGFLGSGKTTFLRKTIRKHQKERLVYLVNEFSSHDVDGPLVEEAGGMALSVPGGSIFCTCLITEFINTMTRIVEDLDAKEPVKGVVIEASGMANPKVIETMLRETGLDKSFSLDQIITVLEPRSFLRLIHTLPNVIAQVEAADLVLLNKCDLYDQSMIQEAHGKVLEINPQVQCVFTQHAEVDVDLFPSKRESRGLSGAYATCRDPNYSSCTINPEAPIQLTALKEGIARFGEEIYRLKGVVETDEGVRFIDYSIAELQIKPASLNSQPGLACILVGEGGEEVNRWIKELGAPIQRVGTV